MFLGHVEKFLVIFTIAWTILGLIYKNMRNLFLFGYFDQNYLTLFDNSLKIEVNDQ